MTGSAVSWCVKWGTYLLPWWSLGLRLINITQSCGPLLSSQTTCQLEPKKETELLLTLTAVFVERKNTQKYQWKWTSISFLITIQRWTPRCALFSRKKFRAMSPVTTNFGHEKTCPIVFVRLPFNSDNKKRQRFRSLSMMVVNQRKRGGSPRAELPRFPFALDGSGKYVSVRRTRGEDIPHLVQRITTSGGGGVMILTGSWERMIVARNIPPNLSTRAIIISLLCISFENVIWFSSRREWK